ncbi:unnamed protein product [Parajaminaea phylloscopi]
MMSSLLFLPWSSMASTCAAYHIPSSATSGQATSLANKMEMAVASPTSHGGISSEDGRDRESIGSGDAQLSHHSQEQTRSLLDLFPPTNVLAVTRSPAEGFTKGDTDLRAASLIYSLPSKDDGLDELVIKTNSLAELASTGYSLGVAVGDIKTQCRALEAYAIAHKRMSFVEQKQYNAWLSGSPMPVLPTDYFYDMAPRILPSGRGRFCPPLSLKRAALNQLYAAPDWETIEQVSLQETASPDQVAAFEQYFPQLQPLLLAHCRVLSLIHPEGPDTIANERIRKECTTLSQCIEQIDHFVNKTVADVQSMAQAATANCDILRARLATLTRAADTIESFTGEGQAHFEGLDQHVGARQGWTLKRSAGEMTDTGATERRKLLTPSTRSRKSLRDSHSSRANGRRTPDQRLLDGANEVTALSDRRGSSQITLGARRAVGDLSPLSQTRARTRSNSSHNIAADQCDAQDSADSSEEGRIMPEPRNDGFDHRDVPADAPLWSQRKSVSPVAEAVDGPALYLRRSEPPNAPADRLAKDPRGHDPSHTGSDGQHKLVETTVSGGEDTGKELEQHDGQDFFPMRQRGESQPPPHAGFSWPLSGSARQRRERSGEATPNKADDNTINSNAKGRTGANEGGGLWPTGPRASSTSDAEGQAKGSMGPPSLPSTKGTESFFTTKRQFFPSLGKPRSGTTTQATTTALEPSASPSNEATATSAKQPVREAQPTEAAPAKTGEAPGKQ